MIIIPLDAFTQIQFTEIVTSEDWDKTIQDATENNKLIFLDIYATWCGPCKYLDSNVYPDPDLSAYYNANFINIKMDGETEFGRQKAAQFALRAYPSMYYLSPREDIMATVVGVKQAPDLKAFGQKVTMSSGKILEYAGKYESGELNAHEMITYRDLLIDFGSEQEAEKISQSILPALTEDQILSAEYKEVVLGTSSDLDGKIFKIIGNDTDRFNEIYTGEEREKIFSSIYDASLIKAINTKDQVYLERIITELLPVYVADDTATLGRATYVTYKLFDANTLNWESYEKRVMTEYEKKHKGDDKFLYAESYDIVNNYVQAPDAVNIAGKIMDVAIRINPSFDNLIMVSYLGGISSDYQKSRDAIQKIEGMQLSEEQKNILNELKNMIDEAEQESN